MRAGSVVPLCKLGSSGWARRQRGFTIIAVLAATAIVGIAAHRVMAYVSHEAQREREERMVEMARAYVRAIGTYYESSPGGVKRWPQRLEDLTDDTRFVTMRRHLREIQPDPIMRGPWGVVAAEDGGIQGVYSQSGERPVRTAAIDFFGTALPVGARYSDWQFIYRPQALPSPRS